jgi:Phytanoyl-CoA dioxygenase (PhyH)
LAGAYGARYADADADVAVEPAFDIPMMSADTPFAGELVADDPRFWPNSHYLMGAPTVPTSGEITCFRANARWHADMTSAVAGVKFMAYLEPCSREGGQLQVLPGSHLPGVGPQLWSYLGQDARRQGHLKDPDDWPVPAYGIDTEPGDVIAFHSNLMHSSVGGTRRTAWDIYYFTDPILSGQGEREIIRDAILHIGDYGTVDFDHGKFPVWRDWASPALSSDARIAALNRLRRLGVLAVENADIGTPQWEPRLTKPSTVWSSGAPARRRSGA